MSPPRRTRRGEVPTLIVPDEQVWTMLGRADDLFGAAPSFDPAATLAVLAPERLPAQLAEPLREWVERIPTPPRVRTGALSLGVIPAAEALAAHRQPDSAAHSSGHGDDSMGHDDGDESASDGHGDMMAIEGSPSADGLVMESMELHRGPLGGPLPGGLSIDATLDGEIVEEARVSGIGAGTGGDSGVSHPAALAPMAAARAIAIAAGDDEAGSPASLATRRHQHRVLRRSQLQP